MTRKPWKIKIFFIFILLAHSPVQIESFSPKVEKSELEGSASNLYHVSMFVTILKSAALFANR